MRHRDLSRITNPIPLPDGAAMKAAAQDKLNRSPVSQNRRGYFKCSGKWERLRVATIRWNNLQLAEVRAKNPRPVRADLPPVIDGTADQRARALRGSRLLTA